MAYVTVPKDLTKVKSKVLFGLTRRQLVCFGAAALIGVPLFFLLRKTVNSSTATVCMIVVMLPLFLLAMYERNGQPLEVIAGQIIQTVFLRPKERPYQTDNFYAAVERQIQVEKEVRKVVQKSKAAAEGAAARYDPEAHPMEAEGQAAEYPEPHIVQLATLHADGFENTV